jgi:uncharacterized SAM-binding protein YcdF (DUF218 family)
VNRRRRGLIAGGTIALLCLYLARAAGTVLVISQPVGVPDVIVSLASHEWERLPVTATIATKYPDSLVVLTQPAYTTLHNCEGCSDRVARLRRAGVQLSRIRVTPRPATSTYGEAVACLEYLRDSRARNILVVTSPYHTRRALATFKRVFSGTQIQVGIRPATGHSPAQPAAWWRRSYDRRYVMYEWAAGVYYALRYGIGIVK